MKKITTHQVNGLNDALEIFVQDEKGPGGAYHDYLIAAFDGSVSCSIKFQKGPIQEVGINGISNEALLAIVQNRLECFQAGPFACQENEDALVATKEAARILKKRTEDRISRGVEGKSLA